MWKRCGTTSDADCSDEPQKPERGVRAYGAKHAERLDFIRRAQAMGFTLEEVRQLDALNRTGNCADTRDLAAAKLALVRHIAGCVD